MHQDIATLLSWHSKQKERRTKRLWRDTSRKLSMATWKESGDIGSKLASLSQDWCSGFGNESGRTAAIWQDLVTVTICLCALNWARFHRYTSPPDPWNVLTNMEFVIGCAAIIAARASGRSSYEALSSEPLPVANEGHHVSHCGLSWHSEICTQSNLRWGSLRKASLADTRCSNKL